MRKKSVFAIVNIVFLLFSVCVFICMARQEIIMMACYAQPQEIREYLESEQKDVLIEKGEKVLQEAGYSWSGQSVVTKRLFRSWIPCLAILVGFDVWLVYVFYRGEKKEKAVEKQKMEWQMKTDLLEKKMEELEKSVCQYEENLYHQLKTPLTGLKLSLEQMDENRKEVMTAQMEAEKMSRLITLFLKERQMNENMIRFHFTQEDLIQLMEEALETVEPLAENRQVSLKTEMDCEHAMIHCDVTWMRECFVTLPENSIEYGNGSTEVRLYNRGSSIHIEVVTAHQTIDEKDLPHLFERFHTCSDNHFGIGLHMASMIVLQHHGTLRAYNRDENAVFEVILPVMENQDIYSLT